MKGTKKGGGSALGCIGMYDKPVKVTGKPSGGKSSTRKS